MGKTEPGPFTTHLPQRVVDTLRAVRGAQGLHQSRAILSMPERALQLIGLPATTPSHVCQRVTVKYELELAAPAWHATEMVASI